MLLVTLIAGAALVRVVAPHVRKIVAGWELKKPGMKLLDVEVPTKLTGCWTVEERPMVADAIYGIGDRRILEIGRERAEALRRAQWGRRGT